MTVKNDSMLEPVKKLMKNNNTKVQTYTDFCRSWKPKIKGLKYEDVDWRRYELYRPRFTLDQYNEWMSSDGTNFYSKGTVRAKPTPKKKMR
jgi:hypothetical protein